MARADLEKAEPLFVPDRGRLSLELRGQGLVLHHNVQIGVAEITLAQHDRNNATKM